MKEAQAKDVLVDELFYCPTTRKFYRRLAKKLCSFPSHIAAAAAQGGEERCFRAYDTVVV